MRYYRARVARVAQLSPTMRRVTFTSPELTRLPFAGADQRVKLLLPLPGQDRPQIDGLDTIWDLLALPREIAPIMRTYTVRRHRRDLGEIDVDFALHGDRGPASAWAIRATAGQHVALFGPAALYAPKPTVEWQLLLGDETALPAIGAIVEMLTPRDRARVLIEVPDPRDVQQFSSCAQLDVTWLCRGSAAAAASTALLDAVRALELPAVPSYFWLSGESSIVTAIRRHLVRERDVPREGITFTGYWKQGCAESQR